MKKVVFIIVGLLALIGITVGAYFFVNSKNDGKKTISLTYKTNGGVPYKWVYEIGDESIVEFVEAKDITEEKYKNLEGGPVSINYIFRGKKRGQTTVTFKYVSIVTREVEKEEKVTFNVDRHKNISLVANIKK